MAVRADLLKSFSDLAKMSSGMVQPVWYQKLFVQQCRAVWFGVFVQIVYGKGVCCGYWCVILMSLIIVGGIWSKVGLDDVGGNFQP